MLSPYLVENRHVAVKRCRHGLFMYNRNDTFVGRGLDLYGEWCDFEIQLMRRFIRLGDTVLDVGAHIGTHTIAFANLVGPGGLVHAFEPQRRFFMMLAGNVALNALENVFCHHKAVGEANGEIMIPPLPPPETSYNFSAVPIPPSSEAGEAVALVALDTLALERCALIKVDAEGMDPQVIAGARALIERFRPILYVENGDQQSSSRLSKVLDDIGYRAWWSIFPYFDPRNFYCNTLNVWQEFVPSCNVLCAPKRANIEVGELEPFLGPSDDWKAAVQRINSRSKR
jgi:FkbM family methyltransferase